MSQIKDGGPAFPRQLPNVTVPQDEALDLIRRYAGMSLRDYFAAAYLTGAASHLSARFENFQYVARVAYEIADAMLAEREKGSGS